MALTNEDVMRVASLARLWLAPEEVSELTMKLSQVVHLVEQLAEVNTEGVEPLVHAFDLHNVLAPDILGQSIPRSEALKNAPASDEECFRVPAVLG